MKFLRLKATAFATLLLCTTLCVGWTISPLHPPISKIDTQRLTSTANQSTFEETLSAINSLIQSAAISEKYRVGATDMAGYGMVLTVQTCICC